WKSADRSAWPRRPSGCGVLEWGRRKSPAGWEWTRPGSRRCSRPIWKMRTPSGGKV
ncbi:MAG: hypothetical protein AVDCRST_MAG55-76, partial [uncultured Rubrobacteraceae bacterium]